MTARRHEAEMLLLAMFAALPLYVTQTIALPPLIAFHLLMGMMLARVLSGRSPEVVPLVVMRVLAVAYVLFYVVDAAVISRNAIAASTHLVLFITAYQPLESMQRNNDAQRLLTASLLAVAGIATATHITIVPFVAAFSFLLFRQLIHLSHAESARLAGTAAVPPPPSGRAAGFYLAGTAAVAMLLFPMLPRVRNPLVPGIAGSSASTGLSDTIDFNEQRNISPDSTVVSRVWMGQEAIPFFTPLRLRGAVYERFRRNEWLQGRRDFAPLDTRDGATRIARASGFTRRATVQQRFIVGSRLFLPVGTYEVDGPPQVYEGPTRDIYMVWQSRSDMISYDVRMARETAPLRVRRVAVADYPVTPEIAAMARRIVGPERDPMRQAAAIEQYLSSNFHYIPNPADIGHTMSVDQFLLKERRGHCEYFAAGMVALLTALDIPARIVGGFYGGKLNPLTGYFVVRRDDAHAWVEAYDGAGWQTFDPTPPGLRPGNTQTGLVRAYASALGDSVNYFWDRYILTFGLADQIALAIDAISTMRHAAASLSRAGRRSFAALFDARYLLVVGVLAAAALLVWIMRGRRSLFHELAAHLRRLGIEVGPSMTVEEAVAQLRRTRPDAAVALAPLIAMYEEERFSGRTDRRRVAMLRKRLTAL